LKIKLVEKSAKIMRIMAMVPAMLMGCLLTFSACASIPVQERGDILTRLPEQFAGNDAITSNNLSWKQSFHSEQLRNDILTLRKENFELEAARARIEQAAAVYGISRSDLFSRLDARAGFKRSRTKEDTIGATTIMRNTIDFEAALQCEPDIWGRLKARQKAASLSFEEQQALMDQTALNLQTLLVESWVTHHAARRLEQVVEEQKETNAQLLDLTELYLAQGQGNALDVLQQRGSLVAIERALPEVNSSKRRTANAYFVLMGHIPDGSNLVKDEWPILEHLSAVTTPRKLLVDRPDLRASFLALQAVDQEVAATIADRLPRLSIELSYMVSGSSLSTVGNGPVLQFVSNLLAPVFDAGRLKAEAVLRKAEARELLAALKQAILEALREVEDALALEQALFEKKIVLEDEIAISRETVDKARLRYVNGQDSFLSVLIMLENLQILQQENILLQQDLLINRARLLKALGAKWSYQSETS
jgi:NodT family efflux transporter outer membrane factor (OMF) lipoprotein